MSLEVLQAQNAVDCSYLTTDGSLQPSQFLTLVAKFNPFRQQASYGLVVAFHFGWLHIHTLAF